MQASQQGDGFFPDGPTQDMCPPTPIPGTWESVLTWPGYVPSWTPGRVSSPEAHAEPGGEAQPEPTAP